MKPGKLIIRNLIFFWRTNLAIVAGVAIATAVLSGALQVGQSVRNSLRYLLFERIGSVDSILSSNNFFDEKLAEQLSFRSESCPIIYLKGIVIQEKTRVRVQDVNVYGIDERFWKFHGIANQLPPADRSALVGSGLAHQLDIRPGDGLLLRVETQQSIPREWLYGRRDSIGRTIRLDCREILDAGKLGEFALHPSQGNILSIFVPLKRLQKDLGQPSRINAILFSAGKAGVAPMSTGITASDSIRRDLKSHCKLEDLGLKLRDLPSGQGFSLESSRIIIDDELAHAALQSAITTGMKSSPLYAYLANSIRANGREIPYSVITAADLGKGALASVSGVTSACPKSSPLAENDSIWLTDWASKDLAASIGDPVEIDYYLWQDSGRLITRTARFHLAGVVAGSGDVNASLAPEIPGITEAQSISAWDPPFPLDLGRIRKVDEDFWNRYKATPKAFITLERGQELWGNRFGRLTAIRIAVPRGLNPDSARQLFSADLLSRLDPQQFGFSVTAIKEQGLAASRGSTDFGEYFVYFSSFLIAAAVLLSGLFFKLMIEQRVREVGILRTAGFSIQFLRRIFVSEGIALSIAGSILGMVGSVAYGWLMIFGLRAWWVGAVGTQRLRFSVSWDDLFIGSVAGILFSVLAILWTLRGLQRNSPRGLLAGVLESTALRAGRARALGLTAVISAFIAALLLIGSASGKISQLEGFFSSGSLLLISALCATGRYLRRTKPRSIRGNGWPAFARLGLRNAMHRPARSLVCASLIASAIFIIISMEAFRHDSRSISLEPNSGTGGYPLIAESALPIVHDLNSEDGRDATGLSALGPGRMEGLRFVSFRERPGDDASCLNLYAPQEPKILGAPHAFIAAGRFAFQKSIDRNLKSNPWRLLEASSRDSTIPAIADANTIEYILHLSVGSEMTIRGDSGTPVRLRLVAALKDSIFQGELLISESNFLRVFPEHQGYRFFLLHLLPTRAAELREPLQEALSDWGLRIESSQERLSAFHRVENAYLSTFQSLGALGLVLGTMGLATLLLRNVLERRQELAILRAVGYRTRTLAGIILYENFLLVCWGLTSGTICAFLAVIPALQSRGASFPFAVSGLILISVLAAGLVSSIVAVIAALRSPLLSALHSE